VALPVNRPLNIERVYAYLADQSTASTAYARAPVNGAIVEIGVINYAAVTTAPNVLTAAINGTAITGISISSTNSGAAAGDTYTDEPSGTAQNRTVTEGDKISFISDGAGSGTVPCMFYADIKIGG
jgi:hypothetical protein